MLSLVAQACDRRPDPLCNTTTVDGTSLTCKVTASFPRDPSLLDVPYKTTSCREEAFAEGVKEALSTYRTTAVDLWSKAFVLVDGCQWAIAYYMLDPCESMRESFKLCAQYKVTCGVYMIGNLTYNPSDFPCRCGSLVRSCQSSQACETTTAQINTSCLVTDTAATTISTTTFADPGNGLATTSADPGNGLETTSADPGSGLATTFADPGNGLATTSADPGNGLETTFADPGSGSETTFADPGNGLASGQAPIASAIGTLHALLVINFICR